MWWGGDDGKFVTTRSIRRRFVGAIFAVALPPSRVYHHAVCITAGHCPGGTCCCTMAAGGRVHEPGHRTMTSGAVCIPEQEGGDEHVPGRHT
jgi:hypothetical protein